MKRFSLDTGRDEKLILRLTSLGVPLRLCGDASLFRQVRNLRVRHLRNRSTKNEKQFTQNVLIFLKSRPLALSQSSAPE